LALSGQNDKHNNRNDYAGGDIIGRGKNYYSDYNKEDDLDIKKIIHAVLQHKWIVLAVVIITTIFFAAIAFLRLPIYQSSGTIIISKIDNNNLSVANSNISNLIQNAYGIGTANNINDELQILKSRSLIMGVAQKLEMEKWQSNGIKFPVLWRDYPGDSSSVSIDTVYHRIQENLTISQINPQSNAVKITFLSYSPLEASHLVEMTMNTYIAFSTRENRYMAGSALKFLDKERKRIQQRLDSAEVQLKGFMKDNKLVDLDNQTKQLIQTLSDLQNQREQIYIKQVAASTAITNYRTQLDSLKPGLPAQYAEALSPTLNMYQYQLAELKTRQMLMLDKNPMLKKNPLAEPDYRKLDRQIKNLQKNIKELTAQLIKKNNARYLGFLDNATGEMEQQVATLQEKLLELQIQKKQYDVQMKVLTERLNSLNNSLNALPGNMIQLFQLKRAVSMNESMFKTIAQQAAEMALWQQTQSGLGRIIDHGYIPIKPVKPKKFLYIVIGILTGLVLSIGFVVYKESITTEINSIEVLKKFGEPILAVIPDTREYIREYFSNRKKTKIGDREISTNLISLLDSISPVAESYSRLQTNIIFSNPDQSVKTILVTSPNEGEGKTTLISNLAISIAESNKKVLLIDCDFRRPKMNKLFGTQNVSGITDILFNDADPNDVIMESVVSNLKLLSTGKQITNPKTIVGSEKLRHVIKYLTLDFDYVLIDTPPFGLITDAAPLIKLADGVIVAVRFNKTLDIEVEQTLLNLNQINASILGVTMIGFDHSKSKDYGYKHYYKNVYNSYGRYHNG
jgi:capsular exopolysaccharide synthesis family protein